MFAYFHTWRICIVNAREKWPFEYWLVISNTLSSLEFCLGLTDQKTQQRMSKINTSGLIN